MRSAAAKAMTILLEPGSRRIVLAFVAAMCCFQSALPASASCS
jgi:hypothetical protein